jgi:hypothetical protein
MIIKDTSIVSPSNNVIVKNLKNYEMKVGGWNTEALFKWKYKLE